MGNNHDFNRKLQKQAEPRIKRIVRLKERGWTWREIGEFFDITPQRAQKLGARGQRTQDTP